MRKVLFFTERLSGIGDRIAGFTGGLSARETLVLASLAATALALMVVWYFEGEMQHFLLYYFVPMALPTVAFVIERAADWRVASRLARGLDFAIVSTSLLRAGLPMPGYSGHALFLTYALLTSSRFETRSLAFAVLLQVIWLKLAWQDWTLLGGMLLGLLASEQYRRSRN